MKSYRIAHYFAPVIAAVALGLPGSLPLKSQTMGSIPHANVGMDAHQESPRSLGPVAVVMQHNDNARTGANLSETILKPSNVNLQHFGMLSKHVVDDQVYSQPLILTNIQVGGGYHDLVFVTTVNNSVYAFDANDSTASEPTWHVNFGLPATLHDYDFGCLDINGKMGIIGTPVIDPSRRVLYVVALTKTAGQFEQRLHEVDVSTGAEMPGSPVTITAPDFNPLMQNQRPGLLLDRGRVFIGYASHCDKEPYHGFLLSYDAETLKQTGVLNTSPAGEGASIWQSGQAPAVDKDGNIIFVTGNGSWNGVSQFSESFMKVTPDLQIVDWFTPSNHLQLDHDDNDLNASGATLIPGTRVIAGGSKEGALYLVNSESFGHLGDDHLIQHFKPTGSHLHNLVYWQSEKNGRLLYMWGQRDKERVYRFNPDDTLDETPFQILPTPNEGHPGAMLSLSAAGGKDGILWAAIHHVGDSWHMSQPGILYAFDADDINHELWNSLEYPSRDDCGEYSKMAPPTVANGRVYLASFGTKNTGTGQLCIYGLLPDGAVPEPPANVRAQADAKNVTIEWDAVPRAITYEVVSTQGGGPHVVGSGLTKPVFTEPAAEEGKTEYHVIAVNSNGPGMPSSGVIFTIKEVPKMRVMH
jgi:hypothetical protein